MSASKPERRAPAASPALERKVNSPIYIRRSFVFESVAKAAGKKAPHAEPTINPEIKRIQRFSESRIIRPETAVITTPKPINLNFPNLSARIQRKHGSQRSEEVGRKEQAGSISSKFNIMRACKLGENRNHSIGKPHNCNSCSIN